MQQVSDWAPELIEKEHYAKQNATVLLFVFDNQTRNTATTVEVAFFSGLKRNMILVLQPYRSCGSEIAGERVLDEYVSVHISTTNYSITDSLVNLNFYTIFTLAVNWLI